MNQKLLTTLELIAIVGLVVFVLWMGGIFTPPPAPTPTPTAFVTNTPASALAPTLFPTPQGTLPPLTVAQGTIAFTSTRDGNSEIYRMGADGTGQQNFTQNGAQDILIGWSPDGDRLAFFSTRSNGWLEIFVMRADGSNPTQLTHSFGTNTAYTAPLSWSPDGRYLLAIRSSPWRLEQYPAANTLDLIHADGSGITPLYAANALIAQASFSPDGQFIMVMLQADSGIGLYSSPFSEKPDFKLANHNCAYTYIWHAKGNRLTCSTSVSFFDLDPDGSNQVSVLANSNSIDYANLAAWAPDDSKLLTNFVNWLGASDPNSQALTLIDPTTGKQTVIYRDKDMAIDNTFNWAPDSQWLTFASKKDGHLNIYTLNIYSAQSPVPMQPIQLTGDSGDNYDPQWQPIVTH